MALQMGSLIRQLRKQQGLTQEELARGILSKSELCRIEQNTKIPDIFVLGALFQRLEKTLKYFEIVVSNRDYKRLLTEKEPILAETTVIAEADYFKGIREAKGLSQEEFSSDICARETISQMENGRTLKRSKIQMLMEIQGECFGTYHGFMIAPVYEIYEWVDQYQQMTEQEPKLAQLLLQKIEAELNMELLVNRQFVESSECIEKRVSGRLTPKEELVILERCLRYTMPEYDGSLYRIPYRQEEVILKELISMMNSMGREEAALFLLQELIQKNRKKLIIS